MVARDGTIDDGLDFSRAMIGCPEFAAIGNPK
jgi:hypothetical protein